MKSILAPLFFILFISSCAPVKEKNNQDQSLDEFIKVKMDSAGIVGLAAAIIVNKELAETQGFGYADREAKILFTSKTIMNIASISKTVLGACLMHAVEEKKLSLDEDINTYLPFKWVNPWFPDEKITLRHLATHTSGIADRSPAYDSSYFYGGDAPVPLGEFLKAYFDPRGSLYAKENFLKYKPGSHYSYSNIGAGLAGYVLESVSGLKLNEYSKRYIFQPLKMDDTGYFISEVDMTHHAKLYNMEGDTIIPVRWYGLTTYPDGGVRTSVTDLSKFFNCLLNRGELDGVRILEKESVEEMMRPQFTADHQPDSVDIVEENSGIFWSIDKKGTRIGHSGGDPGVGTVMYYDPMNDLGVIMFINTGVDKKGLKAFIEIYNQLWVHAAELKKQRTPTAGF